MNYWTVKKVKNLRSSQWIKTTHSDLQQSWTSPRGLQQTKGNVDPVSFPVHLIRRHRILCNPLLVMIVWSLAHFFHYEGMLSFIWKEQWAGWFCKTVPPLLFSHLYAMAIQLLIRLSWAGDYSGLSKMNVFSIYYLIVFRTTSIFFLPYLYTCILFLHYLLFLIFF